VTLLGMAEVRGRFGETIEGRLQGACGADTLVGEAARYHLETGGKRVRALLPVWLAENLAGRGEDAVCAGTGFELLHNATLVHDDLQDGDEVRRGRPAVWTRWGPAQAINVGNALFFIGLDQIASGPQGAALVPVACAAMVRIVEGQALEFQLQLPGDHQDAVPPTLSSWERMATGKTAALFSVCCHAGAALAGESAGVVAQSARFGEALGLLFQLQDDLLDLVGDKGRDQRATDIAEGKISYPVAWALSESGGEVDVLERLLAIVRSPRPDTTPGMIAEALDTLTRLGAIRATAARISSIASELGAHPIGRSLPGLVEQIVAPIRHAL